MLPEGFVVLSSIVPGLSIDLKYCGSDNLLGRPLAGYAKDGIALITEPAARSLAKIQDYLQKIEIRKQLSMTEPTLLIWDAYRPQMACEDFWQWSQSDCQKTKNDYYPNVDKRDFFKLGYVARKSSHSRGSTVDLNIVDAVDGKIMPLDMGTRFDFMDVLSHPDNPNMPDQIFHNRQFLKKLMQDFGWLGIDQEWWHFTFTKEPYPDTYFDFPVINYKEL
jgi:D-alanyl-D-alanine dipeptidase